MKKWLIFFLVIFYHQLLFCQHRISSSVGATRFDYFHSFDYSYQKNKFEGGVGFAYGINRTIFQQRFYPKLALNLSYDLIQRPKFELGPCLYGAISWLKIDKSSKHRTVWREIFAGLEWSYGTKWKIGQTITAGYFEQNYFNSITNKRSDVGSWGYFVSIKLIHEI